MSKYMYFFNDGKVVYYSTLSFDNINDSCAIYEQNDDGYYECVAVITILENK